MMTERDRLRLADAVLEILARGNTAEVKRRREGIVVLETRRKNALELDKTE